MAHDHDHENENEDAPGDGALEMAAQGQIFLEMRGQNLELLQIATRIAGYAGDHGPLKPGDVKQALRTIWEVYGELYTWVDPEETDEEEDEEE